MKFNCPKCKQWRHVEEVLGDPTKDHCWFCGTPVAYTDDEVAEMFVNELEDAMPGDIIRRVSPPRPNEAGADDFGPHNPRWWTWTQAYGLADVGTYTRAVVPTLLGGPANGQEIPEHMFKCAAPVYAREPKGRAGEIVIYRRVTLWPCWDAKPFDVYVHTTLRNRPGGEILALLQEQRG